MKKILVEIRLACEDESHIELSEYMIKQMLTTTNHWRSDVLLKVNELPTEPNKITPGATMEYIVSTEIIDGELLIFTKNAIYKQDLKGNFKKQEIIITTEKAN